jgi:hypothetical protein
MPERGLNMLERGLSMPESRLSLPRRGMNMPETNEALVEEEIKAKGLTAPRVTPEQIDQQIIGEYYYVFPGSTLTVCALELKNGFYVVGESAAASPANYDAELGRKIARDRARAKIWVLEGYALRTRLDAEA